MTADQKTRDPVNTIALEVRDKAGVAQLGLMNNQVWYDDPRRLVFTLSRYKFVSKILSGRRNVLEVGCGDGFCARVVRQEVERLTISDYDPLFISDFNERTEPRWPIEARVIDVLDAPITGNYDAAYSLDVLEHIPAEQEDRFLKHLIAGLAPHATVIIGMPSLESQPYASPPSRAGHVNCKTGPDLKALMERHFRHVFLFSMNDEVVHTGYHKMAHYLLALCCDQLEPAK